MSAEPADSIVSAEVVQPCTDLEATLEFFVERLGFRLRAIFPADDPRVATIEGHGLTLRLERDPRAEPCSLRIVRRDLAAEQELIAPNGARVRLVPADTALVLPDLRPDLVLARGGTQARWNRGRAGMLYRDLLPGRLGGRFIASHIRIPEGGPVPDYVHYHRVRFQMIHCYRGWVRVVYEDQGPPFVLQAGDLVLQPPEIRHRVLESSAGLEVIELGCPAEHETRTDPVQALPSAGLRPERRFAGQRFLRHRAAATSWEGWREPGFECRDSGIEAATEGLAGARVVRPAGQLRTTPRRHEGELLFLFVLEGGLRLEAEGRAPDVLGAGDAVTLPAGLEHSWQGCSEDLQLLEVTLPARA